MSTESLIVGEGTKENWAGRDGNLLGYNIDSTTNTFVPREFIVNRNTGKWVLGKDGNLYRVPPNQPALEYYSGGAARGVLVEPGATNLCLQSEDINTTWTTSNATPTQSTETTPDGDSTDKYIKLVDNGTPGSTNTGFVFVSQTLTVSANTKYTASVFLKADGLSTARLSADNYDGTTDGVQYFVLSGAGSLGTASNLDDSSIKAYPNGWYRCSITWTQAASNTVNFLIWVTNSISSASVDLDGTSSIFVWGAQLEASPIATSYIPTTDQIKSRIADDISLTGASSLIGQKDTGGTLLVEVDWRATGASQWLLSVNDGTANNRFMIYNNTTPQLIMFAQANNDIKTSQGESSTSYTGIQKIAFAYKTNDFELYRNGSSISSDTNGSLASLATLTNVDFGQSFGGSAQVNMWIRDARLYKQRLVDSELAALTEIYAPIDGNEFIWNGLLYKVIVKNGLAWLDRNLGATRVATSSTDAEAYGDLYQWGRLADGHQLRNSGTTSTLSSGDVPGHGDFILSPNSPNDWLSSQNDNLWQGVNGVNNPAPPGWRLPTETEWNTERQSWNSNDSVGAFGSPLKLPVAGRRDYDDGSLAALGSVGYYWSSTVNATETETLFFNSGTAAVGSGFFRAYGFSVRCVRDVT